jgi:hypothetical protein
MTPAMNQRFRAARQVHARRFHDETVVLDLSRGDYFALDEVGAAIWERLNEGLALSEVVEHLLSRYDGDAQTVRDDVQRLVEELVAAGLLERRE